MKIDYREPEETADISASRDSDRSEFVKLTMLTIVSVVALYALIGWIVDALVAGIDYEQEMSLFSEMGFANASDQVEDAPESLQEVFDKLVALEQVAPIDYSLVVLAESDPNAFAFPGGTIGVTSGLLASVEDELSLAFVLGHELGHFHNRDHLRGMGRGIGLTVLYSLIFGSALDIDAASLPLLVLSSSYSRGQESQADRFGLELMLDAYGTTEGFDTLFEQLEARADQSGWTSMFATHPLPRNRITDLNDYVLQLQAQRGNSIN